MRQKFTRSRCTSSVDPLLAHLELCAFNFEHKHATFAQSLAKMVRYAGFDMATEIQCIPGENVRPADIYIFHGPDGIPIAIDVTVVSPQTHDLSRPAANPNHAKRFKITKYARNIKNLGLNLA